MTLKIEVGKYYRTRDGRKVGPVFRGTKNEKWPWVVPQEFVTYADNGMHWSSGAESPCDLIAEWTDEPEPAPIDNASPLRRHAKAERPAPELTAITTPFGLLPPETHKALRDHGGPYQIYRGYGWEAASNRTDLWAGDCVFRVNPKAQLREGYAVTLFRSAREAKTAHPGCDPIFVREVKE